MVEELGIGDQLALLERGVSSQAENDGSMSRKSGAQGIHLSKTNKEERVVRLFRRYWLPAS